MSYLHVVVPHESPSCCAKRRFSTTFPNQLHTHMMPQEFEASVQTINAAYNKIPAGPAVAHIALILIYVVGLMAIINPSMYTGNHYSYRDSFNYYTFWGGWAVVVGSIIGMVCTARWIRNRRVTELNNALASTNMVYNQRGLAWRVVNPGLRNMTIEISALAPIQPPQPIPVQFNQQPMYAAQPIQLGMMNQPVYQPPYYHPAQAQQQQVTSPSHAPVNHSVNHSVNPPQYIHTNQYPNVYPAEHANTPLMQQQHY